METPLSTRIVTPSHTLVSSANNENLTLTRRAEECEKSVTKSKQTSGKKPKQDRSALVDVTNDSPIVGLAMENPETPSSAMSKKRDGSRACYTKTPGSGETLLRDQVKTLLQKVDEEEELSKITTENRPFFNIRGLVSTPLFRFADPTPSDTPQVLMVDGIHLIPQMVGEMSNRKNQEEFASDNLIIRSLLQEFSEKSEGSDSPQCSSLLICQANARSTRIYEDEEGEDSLDQKSDIKCASAEEEEDNYDDDAGSFQELCEEMSRIGINGATKFTGKHIRFVYNSDDELLGDEELLYS